VGRLRNAGLDGFCVDVTAPDVRELGAWVVRALIPDLYPLTIGRVEQLSHPRLADVRTINLDPHPFP
jgi:ribosomal protein S12 methylthiotransferase accessory factor